MDRTILHCDCNGFYASVECVNNPKLKNVPMAVGGDVESRHGIILAKNELAKKYNIQTAETIWQAKRKCPELVIVPPHHDEYQKYSVMVNDVYKRFTDLVEPFGIDESWLDVSGSRTLFGDGVTIANTLRKIIREQIGLTISVGVSFNKIFAKLGSDLKKPDATTVITRENYKQLIYPLPANFLLYVGESTRKALERLNINTIGELAAADRRMLADVLGKSGDMLWKYANAMDTDPVKSVYFEKEIKSVGKGLTFSENIIGYENIRHEVYALADNVASRLRKYGQKCRTVQITIRNPDFKSISRQAQLTHPTDLTRCIAELAMQLVQKSWTESSPVRMITVTAANLVNNDSVSEQLSFFDDDDIEKREKQETLEHTLDDIRGKFGNDIIKFGKNRKM